MTPFFDHFAKHFNNQLFTLLFHQQNKNDKIKNKWRIV